MPRSYYQPRRRQFPVLTDEQQAAWKDAIRERTGASLRFASDIYVDPRSGRVMAGSEYVARVAPDSSGDPDDATDWTTHVQTIDYGKRVW